MYGPPPDPRQVFAPTGPVVAWEAWLACLVVGVAIAVVARPKRPFLFVVGSVIALTTPLAWFLPTYVWGAYPTIDKSGSLLFYLDGVHRRLFDVNDPAMRLIGVHVGHLWSVAALDLVLEPFAAFNARALINVVLGWYCAYLLLREMTGNREVALLLGAPWGLGLHVMRDINWYTVEKSAVFWLPLYAWALLRARRGGRWIVVAALVYVATCFDNLYFGVVAAMIGGFALLSRDRNVTLAVVASAVAALPLLGLQWRLMHGPGTLGDPETFLSQRAALDVFSLSPPRWNRLEAWRALNLVALALAAVGLRRDLRLAAAALFFALLSLGPASPLYSALVTVVPGLWRIAKPETFFFGAWLALLCIAARQLTRMAPSPRTLAVLALLLVFGWGISVRTHPVYPRLTRFVADDLSEDWQRSVPTAP